MFQPDLAKAYRKVARSASPPLLQRTCRRLRRAAVRGANAQQFGPPMESTRSTKRARAELIAIIDAYDDPDLVKQRNRAAYATSDLHNFDAYYGLPDFGAPGGPTFTKLDEYGGTNYPPTQPNDTNWDMEESLDVEWAHAVAPAANIVLIEANSSYAGDLISDGRKYCSATANSFRGSR